MRFCLVVVILFCSGCASGLTRFVHPAAATLKSPNVELTQTGSAATPATANVTTTKTSVPLPAGSTITISTPPTLPSAKWIPVSLEQTVTSSSLSGPTSFTPPAGPTPQALADASLRTYLWIGLVIGLVAAAFGLVRLWNLVMWGGLCVSAGCGIGLFLQTSPWIFALIGAGFALKFAGPYIWHTQIKTTTTAATDVNK